MPETKPALPAQKSSRVRTALAIAVSLSAALVSHTACGETVASKAALGTIPVLTDSYENVEASLAFDIVPTDQMARIKGASGTSSLPLISPENRLLIALPLEGVKSSVATLGDAISPHFSIVAEGANIAATIRLNAALQLPNGSRILIDIEQRVPNTGTPVTAR